MVYVYPIVAVICLWWLTTLVALYRAGLPEDSYRKTFFWASILGNIGVAVVIFSSQYATPIAAFASFTGGLAIWSWHELSYLLGFVSGPSPKPCPPDVGMAARFRHGVAACLYHELAVIGTAVLMVVLLWGTPNTTGVMAFCVLWLMRWSTKINIFLGVRNLHTEFWPQRLQYLASYVRNARMNAFFPFSMLAAVAAFYYFLNNLGGTGNDFETTAALLTLTLLSLAVLEHVLLMIKIPDAILWRLAQSRNGSESG